jgi:alpha-mannosidase
MLRVFNSLSWNRTDPVVAELPALAGDDWAAVSADGAEHPLQIVSRNGNTVRAIFEGAEVPSVGYADLRIAKPSRRIASALRIREREMETDSFRLELDGNGGITRIFDKEFGREVLVPGGLGGELQLFQDGPESEDAWNLHESATKRRYPMEGECSVAVVEPGPVRGAVRVRRTHRDSVFEQDIVIHAGMRRIDFVMRIDWRERNTLLKIAFPLALRSTKATYEVQFGAVERPTHRNTSWDRQKFEVPVQRWADIAESGYGVSLLNDSQYGCDACENVLRLSLLRSPVFPDPEADRGYHEFTCSLFPHPGSWAEGGTVRRAWELNTPARTVPWTADGASSGEAASFLTVEGAPGAVIQTLKPAEDGRGRILRLYEAHGGRGTVRVKTSLPLRAVTECNAVEEDLHPVPPTADGFAFELLPFQIRSFRLS